MGRLEEAKGAGALAEHSALGRFGKVQEIAEVLAFCTSDKPGYLTGTDILVDGGPGQKMSAKENDRDPAEPLTTPSRGYTVVWHARSRCGRCRVERDEVEAVDLGRVPEENLASLRTR